MLQPIVIIKRNLNTNNKFKLLFINLLKQYYICGYIKTKLIRYKNRYMIHNIANDSAIMFLTDLINNQTVLTSNDYLKKKNIFQNSMRLNTHLLSIENICKYFKKDMTSGSYFYAYQANIAMTFLDCYYNRKQKIKKSYMNNNDINIIAINAATQFINNLCK